MGVLDRAGIADEFKLLLINNPGPISWDYKAELMINGTPYPVARVNSFTINRDYQNDFSDVINLSVRVDLRIFEGLIIPNARDFDVRLTRRLIGTTGEKKPQNYRYVREFKAFLENTPDTKMSKGQRGGEAGPDDALGNFLDINIQLLDKVVHRMNLTKIGGTQHGSLKEIIRYNLSFELGKPEIKKTLLHEDYLGVRGVDIENPTNTTEEPYVIVPSGMPLTHLPQYIQKTIGYFASGMGYYYQDGWWHVYPLLDTTRFDKYKKNLTVLCVPEDEMPVSERTYLYREEQLYVFSTGKRAVIDPSDKLTHESGSILRWWSAEDILDGPFKIENGEGETNSEVNTRKLTMRQRKDGQHDVVNLEGNFTANPHKLTALHTAKKGRYLTTVWTNCDYRLLYPGMPTKVLYVENDEIVEVMGTLLKLVISSEPDSEMHTDIKFSDVAILTIFIDDDEKRSN